MDCYFQKQNTYKVFLSITDFELTIYILNIFLNTVKLFFLNVYLIKRTRPALIFKAVLYNIKNNVRIYLK